MSVYSCIFLHISFTQFTTNSYKNQRNYFFVNVAIYKRLSDWINLQPVKQILHEFVHSSFAMPVYFAWSIDVGTSIILRE